MKTRLLLLLLFALPLLSCDDDPEGTPMGRFVYYVQGDGSGPGVFRRFDIESGRDTEQEPDGAVLLSDVAGNGRLLVMTSEGATLRLYGRCEGGSIVPVPLPVAENPADEYLLAQGPAAISHDGHHAAYLVYRRPVGNPDTATWQAELCRFDCGAWTMNRLDVSAFLRERFATMGIDCVPDKVALRSLGVSTDGGLQWLDLDVFGLDAGRHERRHSAVLAADASGLRLLRTHEIIPGPAEERHWFAIAVFEPRSALLYLWLEGAGSVIDCRNGSEQPSAGATSRYLTHTVASAGTGEIALWNSGAYLGLYRPADVQSVSVIAAREDLQVKFPDLRFYTQHSRTKWCAVSPDGEWIAFIESRELDDCLFVIRRDGSGLRRIAEGVFDIAPVVSDLVPY